MKLVGSNGSPFATRVKLALKLKGMEYEYIEEDLCNKSEILLTSNPAFQKVPVLLPANKQPIIESLTIMEYLDEIQPNVHPLLPSNPHERAQCRVFAYTFDAQPYNLMKEFMLTRDKERREELKELIIGASMMLEEAFVKLSKGKTFFGGDDIGYLDIVVGAFLGWIIFYERVFDFKVFEEARNPRLLKWGKDMLSHEVVRSVIPSQETHIEFFDMLIGLLPPLPISA